MTSDERAFLDAICEQPDDDTARLVYADWLTEHDRADRGEFIRVEIELARTPPATEEDERRRKVLLDRRAELLKQYKAAWFAPFVPFAKDDSFARGFVQSLDVPANQFLQNAERWFALTPLTHVRISGSRVWDADSANYTWWTGPLFASPFLSRLESLDLEAQQLTATELETFAARDDLPRLRELLLASNALRSEGAIALANMRGLRHLKALDLRGNFITDSGARAIVESEHLIRLEELKMSHNPIRKRNWQMLEDRFGDALVA
jgi:uncharacterized protein (TIGR02996 family)